MEEDDESQSGRVRKVGDGGGGVGEWQVGGRDNFLIWELQRRTVSAPLMRSMLPPSIQGSNRRPRREGDSHLVESELREGRQKEGEGEERRLEEERVDVFDGELAATGGAFALVVDGAEEAALAEHVATDSSRHVGDGGKADGTVLGGGGEKETKRGGNEGRERTLPGKAPSDPVVLE